MRQKHNAVVLTGDLERLACKRLCASSVSKKSKEP